MIFGDGIGREFRMDFAVPSVWGQLVASACACVMREKALLCIYKFRLYTWCMKRIFLIPALKVVGQEGLFSHN